MAIGQYESVNGVARKVTKSYDSVAGIARNVIKKYDGVDGVARLFFAPVNGNAILEVKKVISDTYANDTTYTAEEFILLDIYPKTGGTVFVTYGGLTKTITDTSGAAEPNAQQVFFGTFNGVTDEVETPASGELTIEGDCRGFGCGPYSQSSKDTIQPYCLCVTAVDSFGNVESIPQYALSSGLVGCQLGTIEIQGSVKSIGDHAIQNCSLTSVIIGKNVEFIGYMAFGDSTVASYVPTLKIVEILATTPPNVGTYTTNDGTTRQSVFSEQTEASAGVLEKIVVPKGCGGAYKAAAGWSEHADYIVEET